jgi:hypothetical protein
MSSIGLPCRTRACGGAVIPVVVIIANALVASLQKKCREYTSTLPNRDWRPA